MCECVDVWMCVWYMVYGVGVNILVKASQQLARYLT